MTTIYKPSQILRLVRTERIADPQPRGTGRIVCEEFRHRVQADTESPRYWTNGMYVFCTECRAWKLARVVFGDFEIDLRGERKRYPLTLEGKGIDAARAASRLATVEAPGQDADDGRQPAAGAVPIDGRAEGRRC